MGELTRTQKFSCGLKALSSLFITPIEDKTNVQLSASTAPSKENVPLLQKALGLMISLGGTITLFSALLAVFGVLIVRSHANMWGYSNFIEYDINFYVYEGGRFLINIIFLIGSLAVSLVFIYIIFSAIFHYITRQHKNIESETIMSEKVNEMRCNMFTAQWPRLVLVLVSLVLIIWCIEIFVSIPSQLEIQEDIIYLENTHPVVVKFWQKFPTYKQYQKEMKKHFFHSVLLLGLVGFLLYILYNFFAGFKVYVRQSELEKRYLLGRMLIILFFMIVIILLPIAYGKAVYSSKFNTIKDLKVKTEIKSYFPKEGGFLITKTSSHFVLYYPNTQQLKLLPKEQIQYISVGEKRYFFEKQQ